MITYFALIEDPKSHSLFEEIYYKYRSSMRYIAQKVLHDRQLAEDAVKMRLQTHSLRSQKIFLCFLNLRMTRQEIIFQPLRNMLRLIFIGIDRNRQHR